MDTHCNKRINYKENSSSFGQNKGPSLPIEYKFDNQNQYDANNWKYYPTIITWPYVSKHGLFGGQYIVDIQYYNKNGTFQDSIENILCNDSPYHNTLDEHLHNNIDASNALDIRLQEAIDDLKHDSNHICHNKLHYLCILALFQFAVCCF